MTPRGRPRRRQAPEPTIPVALSDVRRAIAEHFYPRVPAADRAGQARIDRRAEAFLASLGAGAPVIEESD